MQKVVRVGYMDSWTLVEDMNHLIQKNANRRIENIFPIVLNDSGLDFLLVLLSDPVEGTDVTEKAGEAEYQKADH